LSVLLKVFNLALLVLLLNKSIYRTKNSVLAVIFSELIFIDQLYVQLKISVAGSF